MSPRCPRRSDLSQRHDGRLDAEALAALERHLTTCVTCARYGQELERLDASLTAPVADAVPALSGRPWRVRPWMAAAVAGVTLAVVWAAPSPMGSRHGPDVRHYQVPRAGGAAYSVTVRGDAELLSIEVNGASAHFENDQGEKR